jgi:uncharacterized protein YqfA (UPF0365 family)
MNAAPAGNSAALVLAGFAFVNLLFFLILIVMLVFLAPPWMRAFMSGAPVTLLQIIGMRLRGVPPYLIVDSVVTLVHRGHPFDRRLCYEAESLYLAQRGMIQSPEQLADLVEKRLKAA